MIPVKLSLSNFTSYSQSVPVLDFTKFKLAAISGQNGAGKSSLLDAVTWCLWGVSRLGDNSDQLVRLGEEKMWVEFSFELDNHIFTVKRSRSLKSGGSSKLELLSNSSTKGKTLHNLTEGTIKATQQKIIDLLHLNFETFVNSAFLRQGHADEFTTKGPTDRKRILTDILGLSHFDVLEEKAKDKSKETQTKLQLLEYQILEVEAELSQKEERVEKKKQAEDKVSLYENNIKTLEKDLKEKRETGETLKIANKQREKLNQTYWENKNELDRIINQGKNRKETITKLSQELENLKGVASKLEEFKGLQREKERLEKDRQKKLEIENILAKIQGEINLQKQQTNQISQEIIKLKGQRAATQKPGSKCPTCGQEIGKTEKEHVHQEISLQIEKLQKELSKIDSHKNEGEVSKYNKLLAVIDFNPQHYQEIIQKLQDQEKIQKQKEIKLQIQATIETEQKVVLELRELFINKKVQVDKLEKEIASLPDLSEKLELSLQETLKIENQLLQIREEEKIARSALGQITELMSQTKQLEKLHKEQQEKKQLLHKEKEVFDELSLAFGKKGIQAMIIETAIPEIEDETNRLLEKLSEGKMKVTMETQRETKGKIAGEKGIIETLDIIISDETGERPYEGYSVAGNEPVYVRQNDQIQVLPIQDLWGEDSLTKIDGEYQFQRANCEALCYVEGKAFWQKVDKVLRHKSPKKILEIKCVPGNYTVQLTKNHSVYVFTKAGLKVKRTEDLKPGEYLLSPKVIPQKDKVTTLDLINYISQEFSRNRSLNNKPLNSNSKFIWSRCDQKIKRFISFNKNFAEMIGIAVAEGSGKTSYIISCGHNRHLAERITFLASQTFGTSKRSLGFISSDKVKKYIQKTPGISSTNPREQYSPDIGGRLVAHILKNMVGQTAAQKKIPAFIFNAPKEIKAAFLKGLVKGDGHISVYKEYSKSSVSITTISKKLVGGVVFLCRQLGIWARIENHGEAGFRRGMNHQKSYRIVISGKKNLEILGFGKIVSDYDTATKYEGIPCSLVGISRCNNQRFIRGKGDEKFYCGINKIPKSALNQYLNIKNLIVDWNIVKIKEVKEVAATTKHVYDLMIPDNNSFVAGNGAILVHNSGGEQFRVNFALRLALSRLLTHRAGAKLQFLVVDEGFGTQDAQGRSRIVEALEAIKNDFAKILVITHLEELKEEFPIRIEVQKTSTGSSFEVVGI